MRTISPLRSLAFLCFFIAPLVWLAGCGGGKLLLKQETLSTLSYTPSNEHRIVYFHKLFTYTHDGRLLEKTHQVVRVGQNAAAYPAALTVFDYAIERLLEFEARVVHSDGDIETFSTSNLTNFNLSNSQRIAEQYLKAAYVKEKITPGDFVETVSIHELTLPQIGIEFSLAELDYAAQNITCAIELPGKDSLQYILANDSIAPTRKDTLGNQTLTFRWQRYAPPARRHHVMEKINRSPKLYAVHAPQSWQSMGDWYAQLVQPKLQAGPEIEKVAHSIADGKATSKEKMDAIFEYCQRNVRYEIVHLSQGEIIPNNVDAILARKYGDCKDYASLMYAMAKIVDVKTNLALCYRGRGMEFLDQIPVSQFNHLILHFEDSGHHYWYDGTNRVGLSGVTTFDLANARALVIEKGNSRLVTITESPDNLLSITGTLLGKAANGLTGDITVRFHDQYAIDFFWLDHQTNSQKTKNLTETLQSMLNENIIVQNLAWKTDKDQFTIMAFCEFPNCVTTLQGNSYVGLARVLPELLPRAPEEAERDVVFYFPYYNSVSVDLSLADFVSVGQQETAMLQMKYKLPAGPFNKVSREDFLPRLENIMNDFTTAHKLTRKSL